MMPSKAPVANRKPHSMTIHGDTRLDEYYWLRERENPETKAYLEAENAYLESHLEPLAGFRQRLYDEMFARIKQTDLEVPVRRKNFWYSSQTEEGKQYRVYQRSEGSSDAPKRVILDVNALALGHDYCQLGVFNPSPDQQLLAYSTDFDGSERFVVRFKNLKTESLLPDVLENTSYSLEWSSDAKFVFYTVMDDAHRSYRVYRHEMGTPQHADSLIFEEPDETFSVYLNTLNSKAFIEIGVYAKITTEFRLLEVNNPLGEFRVFASRVRGVEYYLEHLPATNEFLVLTNENALNFKLMTAPLGNSSQQNAARENWHEFMTHSETRLLENMFVFRDHLVINGREQGFTQLWIRDFKTGITKRLDMPEPVFSVFPDQNPEFDQSTFRFRYTSLTQPRKVMEVNLETLEQTVLKQDEIEGGYDADQYESRRLEATASDGTKVPISIVFKKGALENGPAPLWLYGYGSYGSSTNPSFATQRLSLLDRGIIFAIAHVRGGSEMGRTWYEQGKFLEKKNTFTDFIACAEHLINEGLTSSDQLAAKGGSAGGLLMGAIANLRPDLFKVILAGVPFVDVITTMLDPSIPLTTLEYDEWGNPNDATYYEYMKSYSPYDQLEAKAYPHLLVTTGLNDPRVAYWEPAKWVAKLRTLKTDSNMLGLYTNMGAGHGGSSGRFDALKETALEFAFMLDKLGIKS
jgi:oligopeptidase B